MITDTFTRRKTAEFVKCSCCGDRKDVMHFPQLHGKVFGRQCRACVARKKAKRPSGVASLNSFYANRRYPE